MNSEIQEWPWTYNYLGGGSPGVPLVAGAYLRASNLRYVTLSPAFECVLNSNHGRAQFTTADPSGATMSAVANQTAKGGWTWNGDGTGGDTFQSETGDLPSFDGIQQAIQINSVGGGASSIISPTGASGFPVVPQQCSVLRGMIKTNTGAGKTFTVSVLFYKFDGSASGGAVKLMEVPFAAWTRFNVMVAVPQNACFAALQLTAGNGGVMKITDLSL
jgi:hypothetical protein